ncbi:hypothetical protein EDD16DRAFT_1517621 [Pisolithus croceorrhizus]|nr:hypothetical protein EDD16DRAFT_1517621 [Pisolithus croceorrhizus]
MGSSAVSTLTLNGRNWKVYQASLLEAAATKGWLGILSGQETNNESLRWEGKDAQLKMLFYQTVPILLVLKIQNLRTSHEMFDYIATKFRDPTPISIPTEKPIEAPNDDKMQESRTKPNELSVEPPSEERLKDGLTKARSEAWNELYEQPNSRAGGPLKSEHIKVLNGMVKVPDKVKNINEMAHEDLPLKLHTMDMDTSFHKVDVPSPGSGTMNGQSHYPEELQLTVYDPSGTLQWPMAHSQEAEKDEGGCRVLLKGELADCRSDHAGSTSSDKRNL